MSVEEELLLLKQIYDCILVYIYYDYNLGCFIGLVRIKNSHFIKLKGSDEQEIYQKFINYAKATIFSGTNR